MKNNLINRQTNEEEEERKSKYISGIATFVLTASLFVLMWFWKFTYPKPDVLAEESAVMVSLGEPDLGGPNDVPVEPDYTPPTPPTPDTDEAVEQTEDPDAVATKKTEEKKTQEKPKTTPVEKTKPQEEDDLIKKMREKMNKNKTNTGSGDPTKTMAIKATQMAVLQVTQMAVQMEDLQEDLLAVLAKEQAHLTLLAIEN